MRHSLSFLLLLQAQLWQSSGLAEKEVLSLGGLLVLRALRPSVAVHIASQRRKPLQTRPAVCLAGLKLCAVSFPMQTEGCIREVYKSRCFRIIVEKGPTVKIHSSPSTASYVTKVMILKNIERCWSSLVHLSLTSDRSLGPG